MNRIYYFLVMLMVLSLSAQGQAFKPTVGVGTTFVYTLELHGQYAPFELTVKKAADSLLLEWRIRKLASGVYAMTPTARQGATFLNFTQPAPTVITLSDKETFFILSKNAFKELVSKWAFGYDNTTYKVVDGAKAEPLMMGDKKLDVWHVAAEDETTELWILNDPEFPMVCRIRNNPMGVNAVLNIVR